MRILGIFRGFPGLGRVVAGVSLMENLRELYGFEIQVISYLQGAKYLEDKGYKQLFQETSLDYCSIGLLPTHHFSREIHQAIYSFMPDVIIIDGEPLVLQSIKISHPKIKTVVLLNPSDVENVNNDIEAMDYFNASYQLADLAIVHGNRVVETKRNYRRIISIPTIIRSELCKINSSPSNKIYCILGGGTVNVGEQFFDSTVQIGKLCIDIAKKYPDYTWSIVCSSSNIYENLKTEQLQSNVQLISEIIDAEKFYADASLIITRSGRNTLGEVSYLGIPTISFVSGCEYREAEQRLNIKYLDSECIFPATVSVSANEFYNLVYKGLSAQRVGNKLSGNIQAIEAILSLTHDCKNDESYSIVESDITLKM